MLRIVKSKQWHARSLCYVVPLPLRPVTRKAARVLRQVKLRRKEEGILDVSISDIPRPDRSKRRFKPHRCRWCEFPASYVFLIIHAVSATAAWSCIVRIAWQVDQELGVEISEIIQLVPAVVARYMEVHCATLCNELRMRVALPAPMPRIPGLDCRLKPFEGKVVHSKTISSGFVLAIQVIFERASTDAHSLTRAKKLVWSFLGGSYYSAGTGMQFVDELLKDNLVNNCYNFRYGVPLSFRWPHQRCTIAQAISDKLFERERLRVASWMSLSFGNIRDVSLQLFGTREAIFAARELWRAIRLNGLPSIIVIMDAKLASSSVADDDVLPWEIFAGDFDNDALHEAAADLDCLVDHNAWFSGQTMYEIIQRTKETLQTNTLVAYHNTSSAGVLLEFSMVGETGSVLEFLAAVRVKHQGHRMARIQTAFIDHYSYVTSLERENRNQQAALRSLRTQVESTSRSLAGLRFHVVGQLQWHPDERGLQVGEEVDAWWHGQWWAARVCEVGGLHGRRVRVEDPRGAWRCWVSLSDLARFG